MKLLSCLLLTAASAQLAEIGGEEPTMKDALGSFEGTFNGNIPSSFNETSAVIKRDGLSREEKGHFWPQALKQLTGKKSQTLDHFNDKIDSVCIELAKEVENATRCLAPSVYDMRVKSMSFQDVLEYYGKEITTFRDSWRNALKQFTDTADTFVGNPLALLEERDARVFGEKGSALLEKQVPPPAKGGMDLAGVDTEGTIKEFMQPWDNDMKKVADARDLNLGANINQGPGAEEGYEMDEDEKPLDRLRIDGMHPFPTAAGWNGSGTGTSMYREKYGESYNPIKDGEEAPMYITNSDGADIFNIEDYAQRFLYWRNEHITSYNNLVFSTGPYQASALAYVAVLKQLAHQVDQIKKTTLLTFQGYYEGDQNKRIMNAIRLYQQRSFKKAKDIIPDPIKKMQKSPITSCGECEERVGYGGLQATEGTCLPKELFPCGPQTRVDGSVALNPYYLWNDIAELWKRRFQLFDSIGAYFANKRKMSLKQGTERAGWNIMKKLASSFAPFVKAVSNIMGNTHNAVKQQIANVRGNLQASYSGKPNPPVSPAEKAGHKPVAPTRTAQQMENKAAYFTENDIASRWDTVAIASEGSQNTGPYKHPISKTEAMAENEYNGNAEGYMNDEMEYAETIDFGRWEKGYTESIARLNKAFGMSLDFLREESFMIAYLTARDKFDQCSSALKKRVPAFQAIDAAAIAANAEADDQEKATSPDFRDHVKDLLDRYMGAQEGAALSAHEAMDCTEQGRYELELAADAYRYNLEQMAEDTEKSAMRWSGALATLGTAWQSNAFSTLLSVHSLPTQMIQRAKGLQPRSLKQVNIEAVREDVQKTMSLKMRTPNQLYEDVDVSYNPRDFVMPYRLAFWKTKESHTNIYKNFIYTMGPYKSATDAYLSALKTFASEIDHKIQSFLGKSNAAVRDGTFGHERNYNMYWTSFRNGVGMIRTAKHVVATANKNKLYVKQFLMRAFHMNLDDGSMNIGGCDAIGRARKQKVDGHKYDDARPSEGFQAEGNRLGRGTHPCFMGEYSQLNEYTGSLPMVSWLSNEYDIAFGSGEFHGKPEEAKKTRRMLAKYRCNGGGSKDVMEAPEQYPATEGIPGSIRYEQTKCPTGHMLVDQALYKLAYSLWLTHGDHTESTSFAEWLSYDDTTHRPSPKDYVPCSDSEESEYTKVEKGCIEDANSAMTVTGSQSVDSCKELCEADDDCLGFEFGVAYGGTTRSEGDCALFKSDFTTGCDGAAKNTDFYKKEQPHCVAYKQGSTVSGAATPYVIDQSVTLAKDGKAAKAKAQTKAVASKKVSAKKSPKKSHRHFKKSHKTSKKMASYLQVKEAALQRREAFMMGSHLRMGAPAGFKAYNFCESDKDCDHAPGSEDVDPLVCSSPDASEDASEYNAKAGKFVSARQSTQKFCVGYRDEGEKCNQYLCKFGLSCSQTKEGKCVKESYKYHDWWTYDDGLTTHATTNTFGLEYRKARDTFLSCNEKLQSALTGFVDAWAAATQLSHRMESRVCGGQVKTQEGTGTELGMLQKKKGMEAIDTSKFAKDADFDFANPSVIY